jgi:lipopolysaccharide transport system permease protein
MVKTPATVTVRRITACTALCRNSFVIKTVLLTGVLDFAPFNWCCICAGAWGTRICSGNIRSIWVAGMASWLRSIHHFRFFIASSIRNELVNQFARSKLGGLWMVIHPLVMVAIYAFILSAVLSAKFDGIDNRFAYAIYLTSGILGWTLFNEIISRSVNLFVGNANLLKKMVVPKISLPIITVGAVLVNNLMLFLAILVIFAFLGHGPSVHLLWLPLITAVTALLALGIGLIIAVLNVFIRDVAQLVPIVLQFLFWFTPIVYPLKVIPAEFQRFLSFNPMFPVVTAYHDVLAYQQAPNVSALITMAVIGAGLCVLGVWMVRRTSAEMVDVL